MADWKHGSQHSRHWLTGEHRLGDAGQIVLVLLFLAVWAADTFWLAYTTFLNTYVPLAVRIPVAAVALCVGIYLARASTRMVFGEQRDQPHVITTGVFSLVRHPMYLAEILFYVMLLALSLSLSAGAVWLAAIGFLTFISRHEEKLLLARFGADYEQYTRDVPMWLPRLVRRRSPIDGKP